MDHLELSVRQFAEAGRLMCTRVPGHTAAVVDGVEYIFSGRPIAFFNVAVLTGRGIDTDALKAGAERACATRAALPSSAPDGRVTQACFSARCAAPAIAASATVWCGHNGLAGLMSSVSNPPMA